MGPPVRTLAHSLGDTPTVGSGARTLRVIHPGTLRTSSPPPSLSPSVAWLWMDTRGLAVLPWVGAGEETGWSQGRAGAESQEAPSCPLPSPLPAPALGHEAGVQLRVGGLHETATSGRPASMAKELPLPPGQRRPKEVGCGEAPKTLRASSSLPPGCP